MTKLGFLKRNKEPETEKILACEWPTGCAWPKATQTVIDFGFKDPQQRHFCDHHIEKYKLASSGSEAYEPINPIRSD